VPYADLSKARIYYEVSGPADGLPLLLIHGLGASIAMWDPGLIAAFEQARFRVIQFDNRDVGWSSTSPAPFELADMAQDARELVKHVGLDRVHVAGQSMGGMIAQQFAISYPEVTLSLTSIYSAPGRDHIVSDPELAAEHRQQGAASSREEAVQQFIARETISGLEGLDEAWIRAYAEQLDVPAAVIHGRNDPLISFAGGIATARAIPGAELHIFANMRHQLRRDLWPDFVRIIQRTALRAAS
jgi:pimeloyl-ACP methyl ester carboxylesterase